MNGAYQRVPKLGHHDRPIKGSDVGCLTNVRFHNRAIMELAKTQYLSPLLCFFTKTKNATRAGDMRMFLENVKKNMFLTFLRKRMNVKKNIRKNNQRQIPQLGDHGGPI